ncbi:MAG: hypothetical protein PVF43_16670, partial [Candidatus Eiseniibacteriota bacterium]
MYIFLLLAAITAAALLFATGMASRRAWRVVAGLLLGGVTWLFFASLDLWSEALWFAAVGHAQRFWRLLLLRLAVAAAAG